MSAIKISIVIPNYNHAHYLPTALQHALQQTTPAHEILIIDDGSSDNSVAVIQQYMANYPKIRLLQNIKNMGVNYTLNRGLREATGSHVTFAAADDWMEPNLLEAATQLLTLYPNVGLVSGSSWIVYEKQLDKRHAARMPYPIRGSGYIDPHQARNLTNSLDSWFAGNTVILNRLYALQESGYRQELQSFTDNFLCRVLAAKYGCCFTPAKLGTWRICEGGFAQSFNVDVAKQQQVVQAIEQLMRNNYADIFSPNTIYKVTRRFKFNVARTLWNSNNGKYSASLGDFLNTVIDNWLLCNMAKMSLWLTAKLPFCKRKVGQLLLFLSIRPFDLWQQARISLQAFF